MDKVGFTRSYDIIEEGASRAKMDSGGGGVLSSWVNIDGAVMLESMLYHHAAVL